MAVQQEHSGHYSWQQQFQTRKSRKYVVFLGTVSYLLNQTFYSIAVSRNLVLHPSIFTSTFIYHTDFINHTEDV